MVSVDSLIGFLRSEDVQEGDYTFEDLAEMLERMIEKTDGG